MEMILRTEAPVKLCWVCKGDVVIRLKPEGEESARTSGIVLPQDALPLSMMCAVALIVVGFVVGFLVGTS